jgi:hypothetical protein
MRSRHLLPLLALALAACGSSQAQSAGHPAPRPWAGPSYGEAFRARWMDGRAELAAYDITFPRYGTLREGVAVAITVHEGGLAPDTLVKVESTSRPNVPALKLNWAVDFPTGIYDYHQMTSAFVATEDAHGYRAGDPLRVSYGSQEWCGHVYAQTLFDPAGVRYTSHSYFEGEADEAETLERPAGALTEDTLLLWARGLAGPALEPGGEMAIPMLRSLARVRLRHLPLRWDRATLRRGRTPESVEVPAGIFEVERFEADLGDRRWVFLVETEGARRVARFTRDDGLSASLLSAERMPYWQLNGEGDERHLERLGLSPRPRRTP